jgi:hypothetical protein
VPNHGLDSAIVVEIGAAVVIGFILWIGSMIAAPIIMARKGRNGVVGFLLALFLGIIGLIIVIFMGPADNHRLGLRGRPTGFTREDALKLEGTNDSAPTQTCPSCGSHVPQGSDVCRVCLTAIPSGG